MAESPLVEAALTKADVERQLRRSACQRGTNRRRPEKFADSRGVPITVEKLRRVDRPRPCRPKASAVRVRDHGDIARIEIAPEEFARLNHLALRASISARLREAGFASSA
jgi:uncharacterized protein